MSGSLPGASRLWRTIGESARELLALAREARGSRKSTDRATAYDRAFGLQTEDEESHFERGRISSTVAVCGVGSGSAISRPGRPMGSETGDPRAAVHPWS